MRGGGRCRYDAAVWRDPEGGTLPRKPGGMPPVRTGGGGNRTSRSATVSFLMEGGDCLLEIHRFPSLNSTGRIRIGVSVDGGAVQLAESPSTDEWRGNWKKNVLNNVDRLYLKLPRLSAGIHEICVHGIDRYFAFSPLRPLHEGAQRK